jgi:hypothetical protein
MDKKNKTYSKLPTRNINRNIQNERERMEKDSPCKWKPKQAEGATLICEKIVFRTKTVRRDISHYTTVKGSILWEDIMIINIYIFIVGASNFIKAL